MGLQAGQRSGGHLLRQISAFQEDTDIVGQCMKLKADLVLRHAFAGQPRPVDCVLALLNLLFCRATLVVYPLGRKDCGRFSFHGQLSPIHVETTSGAFPTSATQ